MNKLLIPLVALVLLITGGGYYYYVQMPKNSANTETRLADASPTPDSGEQPDVDGSALMTLKELMAGGSQTCTYSATTDNGLTNGTVYVSGGKVRGDFTITTGEDATYQGSMIVDSDYMYTWSDMMPTGMKIAITDEMKNTDPNANKTSGIDLDEKVDYRCQPWVADQSKFVPPVTMTFTEFKLPPKTLSATGSAAPSNANLCSACANLDGEQKTACRTALKCE